MKTSELIEKLQAAVAEHGDIPVIIHSESYLIGDVQYSPRYGAVNITLLLQVVRNTC